MGAKRPGNSGGNDEKLLFVSQEVIDVLGYQKQFDGNENLSLYQKGRSLRRVNQYNP
jgi:hypothetical protein